MDICEVPTKEQTRKVCSHILTKFSAPSPSLVLKTLVEQPKKGKSKRKNTLDDDTSDRETLDDMLNEAVKNQGLTKTASENLRIFITHGCNPLPTDIVQALEKLLDATKKVRTLNDRIKKSKRYFDIVRGIESIQKLVNSLNEMGVIQSPHFHQQGTLGLLPPSYISLDLGLRQRQRHFQGQLYFQALLLADDCEESPEKFYNNDDLLSSNPKLAVKIAEGGHYEEIVRKFRPPGNFGSMQFENYTSARIPMCIGIRFFIRRFVERAYVEASYAAEMEAHKTTGILTDDLESLRRSLGHPTTVFPSIQCLIVSMNGLDSESLLTRAKVASYLWADGIR
jgi:hypothetical protein